MANRDSWKKYEEEKRERASKNKERWQAVIEKSKKEKSKEQKNHSVLPEHETKTKETIEFFSVNLNKKDFEDIKVTPFAGSNSYGYYVNVSHPAIFPVYQDYKNFINEHTILSDAQRHEFERYILKEFNRIGVQKADYLEKPKTKDYDYNR